MYCQRCQWTQLPDDPEVVICDGCQRSEPKATNAVTMAKLEQAMQAIRDALARTPGPVYLNSAAERYYHDIESTATNGLTTIVGDWGQYDPEDIDDAPF